MTIQALDKSIFFGATLIVAIAAFYGIYRLWQRDEAMTEAQPTCVQLVFSKGNLETADVARLVEAIVVQHNMPWSRTITGNQIFARGENSSILWDDSPPPNLPDMMMIRICGKGKSLEWQRVAKAAEKMLSSTESIAIRDAKLQLNSRIHPHCRDASSCFVTVTVPLEFDKLNETVLRTRTKGVTD